MLALVLALLAPPAPQNPAVAQPARQRAGSIAETDYPLAAIQGEEQGTATLDISVSASGQVIGCQIVESSRSAVLDATSCSLVRQRFKYHPARDAAGRPVRSNVRRRIAWNLPKDAPMLPAFAAGELRILISVDPDAPACAVEAAGEAFQQIAERVCPEGLRESEAELERRRSVVMQQIRLIPAGTTAPQQAPVRGTLLARGAADLEVGSDGRVASCREVTVPMQGELPPVCTLFQVPVPVFSPVAAGEARQGRVEIHIYQMGAPET